MTTIAENPLIVETKQRWGKYLLRMAWIIEIIAAIIGLIVAWSMGYQTYNFYVEEYGSFPFIKYLDLILAGLPFVMVASVELLKIPFCFLVYINTNLKVQRVFTIVLIVVTLITFETLALGFERQFNNISVKVQIPEMKLQVIENQIAANLINIEGRGNITPESIRDEYAKQTLDAQKRRDEALLNLDEQKSAYEMMGNEQLVEKKARLEQDRIDQRKRRDEMVQEVKDNYISITAEEQSNQEKIRKGNDLKIGVYKENIKRLESNIATEKLNPTFGGLFNNKVSAWEKQIKEFERLIDKLLDENAKLGTTSATNKELRITEINKEFREKDDDLLLQISDVQKQIDNESEFADEIAHINALKQSIREEYSKTLQDIKDLKEKDIGDLSNNKTIISQIQEQNRELDSQKQKLTKEILYGYRDTQVYRIAQSLFKPGEDGLVDTKHVKLVAKFWFGSLALVVSSMGIFLAFGAFILKHSGKEFESLKKRGSGPIGRAYRKALLAKRKKYRKAKIVTEIKEVIKEVPVNKVEIKEVPKEIIKKEVIHVPIYTNDPDLIKFGTTKVKKILDDD